MSNSDGQMSWTWWIQWNPHVVSSSCSGRMAGWVHTRHIKPPTIFRSKRQHLQRHGPGKKTKAKKKLRSSVRCSTNSQELEAPFFIDYGPSLIHLTNLSTSLQVENLPGNLFMSLKYNPRDNDHLCECMHCLSLFYSS